jgi:hypothetical protein
MSDEPSDDDDDDDDHAADVERERLYSEQYRPPRGQPPAVSGASANIPRTTSGALPPIPQGRITDPSPEYEGEGYGEPPVVTQAQAEWESIQARHRHPTRLSDILEEQTARTSPSRTSYVSGGGPLLPGEGGTGHPSERH